MDTVIIVLVLTALLGAGLMAGVFFVFTVSVIGCENKIIV